MLDSVKALLLVTLGFGLLNPANGEDYAARYKQLHDQHADAQIEPLLNEWREKVPNDPEAWITSANYYFNQSQGPNVSTKKSEAGDYDLVDQKTGKVAGSLSFKPNPAVAKKATTFLEQATKRFPNRLDIWCGLAYMNQERGDFESEFVALKSMTSYARSHADELRWLKGEKLPEPSDRFIPEKLHAYAVYYHNQHRAEGATRFFKIASFAAEQFPNHVYPVNDVAAFYADSGDNRRAREWMEKAHRLAPKDTLVLTNLARTCLKLGDTAAARKWYEEVIKVDARGEYAEEAKNALTGKASH